MKNTLNCHGRLLDLSTASAMGILNLTDDSFFDGAKYTSGEMYLNHAEKMLDQGALIIDIGGQSTRPGAAFLNSEEEWSRLRVPLSKLIREFPDTIFSIDTFHSSVAERAIEGGVSVVNDVSGGNFDPEMFSTVARLKAPYILMHMQGTPATMHINPHYNDVVLEIINFFIERIKRLQEYGHTDIIIDPGFGFGKSIEHNYEILKKLDTLQLLGFPILAGFSRKSMISRVLGLKAETSLNGTTVLNTIALMNGAKILRVHDVQEAREAILLVRKLKSV